MGDLGASRILVAVRIRPPLGRERYEGDRCTTKVDEDTVVIAPPAVSKDVRGEASTYRFDFAFDGDDSQAEVYEDAAGEIIDSVLDGCNAAVLAYGQTGSGKTHTILGYTKAESVGGGAEVSPESGIFLRSLSELFEHQRRQRGKLHVAILLSAVEVYNDEVRDLLNQKQKIQPRDIGDECLLPGLRSESVDGLSSVLKWYNVASAERSVAATKMNATSSRSHAVFIIDVLQVRRSESWPDPPTPAQAHELLLREASESPQRRRSASPQPGARRGSSPVPPRSPSPGLSASMEGVQRSRLCLADLAGCERIERSGATGQALEEAKHINKSLSALGKVVHALHGSQRHISYRDSRLTRILKPCLSTDSRCRVLLCANVSPAPTSFVESKSTLRFANTVKEIKGSMLAPADQAEAKAFGAVRKTADELLADIRLATLQYDYICQMPAFRTKPYLLPHPEAGTHSPVRSPAPRPAQQPGPAVERKAGRTLVPTAQERQLAALTGLLAEAAAHHTEQLREMRALEAQRQKAELQRMAEEAVPTAPGHQRWQDTLAEIEAAEQRLVDEEKMTGVVTAELENWEVSSERTKQETHAAAAAASDAFQEAAARCAALERQQAESAAQLTSVEAALTAEWKRIDEQDALERQESFEAETRHSAAAVWVRKLGALRDAQQRRRAHRLELYAAEDEAAELREAADVPLPPPPPPLVAAEDWKRPLNTAFERTEPPPGDESAEPEREVLVRENGDFDWSTRAPEPWGWDPTRAPEEAEPPKPGGWEWSPAAPEESEWYGLQLPQTISVRVHLPECHSSSDFRLHLADGIFSVVDSENADVAFVKVPVGIPVDVDSMRARYVRRRQELRVELSVRIPMPVAEEVTEELGSFALYSHRVQHLLWDAAIELQRCGRGSLSRERLLRAKRWRRDSTLPAESEPTQSTLPDVSPGTSALASSAATERCPSLPALSTPALTPARAVLDKRLPNQLREVGDTPGLAAMLGAGGGGALTAVATSAASSSRCSSPTGSRRSSRGASVLGGNVGMPRPQRGVRRKSVQPGKVTFEDDEEAQAGD